MTTSRTTTQDMRPPQRLAVPAGCISASELRSLATKLDALAAFHRDRGGPAPDSPCLLEVLVDSGHVSARVRSGERTFKLELVAGAWQFR